MKCPRLMRGEVKDEKGNTLDASQIEGTIWDLMNFGAVIDQVEYHVSDNSLARREAT